MIAVYDKLIYFNEASKYTILRMRTDDQSVPEAARSPYTFRDRMLRFTAVGYGLPQTDSVKLEIEGDWDDGKYGLQFHVEHWHELVPPTTEGLLSYLSSGLLKGIGESTARSMSNGSAQIRSMCWNIIRKSSWRSAASRNRNWRRSKRATRKAAPCGILWSC